MKLLIIRDLNLGYLQRTEHHPYSDVDVIVLNGNICSDAKRTLMYAEDTARANPNTPVILNVGFLDLSFNGTVKEIEDALMMRIVLSGQSPKNLFWPRKPTQILGRTFITATGWVDLTDDQIKQVPIVAKMSMVHEDFYVGDTLVTTKMPKPMSSAELKPIADAEAARLQEFLDSDLPNKVIVRSTMSHDDPHLGGLGMSIPCYSVPVIEGERGKSVIVEI